MTELRRSRNVDTLRDENLAAGWIAPGRDCDEHNSRSVTLAARLKNASRISKESVSSAHRRNISARSCNSLADEFEVMTHLVHRTTPLTVKMGSGLAGAGEQPEPRLEPALGWFKTWSFCLSEPGS